MGLSCDAQVRAGGELAGAQKAGPGVLAQAQGSGAGGICGSSLLPALMLSKAKSSSPKLRGRMGEWV